MNTPRTLRILQKQLDDQVHVSSENRRVSRLIQCPRVHGFTKKPLVLTSGNSVTRFMIIVEQTGFSIGTVA